MQSCSWQNIPKALALAAIILVNPTNRGESGRLPGTLQQEGSTFLPSNSVVTSSAEIEAEKRDAKGTCTIVFPEVVCLRCWSLL